MLRRALKILPLGSRSKADLYNRVMPYSTAYVPRKMVSSDEVAERKRRILQAMKMRTPCNVQPRRSEFKCNAFLEVRPSLKSKCVPPRCIPIDATEYKPKDKMKIHYQRTWTEFKTKRPGRISDKFKLRKVYPNITRRNAKEFRGKICLACEPEDCELPKATRALRPRLLKPSPVPWPCCKIRIPGCQSTRSNRKCVGRSPSCCVKRTAQYKSFSECKNFPIPPQICECNTKPSLCETWQYYRSIR